MSSHFTISSNYEDLSVCDGFEVEFSDEASDLLITVDESLLSKVVVREVDGELTIGLKPFVWAGGTTLKAVLPYNRNIDEIALSGASVLRSARPIEGEELSIRLSGASELEAELNADEIDMELSGASVAKISGVCAELDVELSGASEIVSQHDAHYRFAAGRAEGSMSGSSKMALHCDGNIDVRLSGASIIRYTGDARTGGSTLTGGSQIVRDVF